MQFRVDKVFIGGACPMVNVWLIFCFISFCLFIHGVLMAGVLEWFAIPSSNGSHFVRTHHYDLSILGGLPQHAS